MQALAILTIESADRLMKVLGEYLDHSEASYALIIDRGGAILSQLGEIPPSVDVMTLSALAAGSFAATRELALRVGEQEFSALHQQGKHSQILICSIQDEAMLLTVFGPKTTLGLVRFYAARAVKQIGTVLDRARGEARIPIDLGHDVANGLKDVFHDPTAKRA
ncbi:MAG TPA: roadblock/LC7 domain-containing protein [Verrucomicrobiae bacterium]|nr:roadblock/LC7 domain-containing protein [Verrucomicrobiae bacterium]